MVNGLEMIFIFDLIFLLCTGVTIGVLLEKEYREVYKHAFHILEYILIYFIPVATIIILSFSFLYYVEPSSSLSFDNCILFSTKAFFSLLDYDKQPLNGIYKSYASIEYLLCGILSVALIGILLDKINQDAKNNRWKPIENAAYKELDKESKYIKDDLSTLLFGFVIDQDQSYDEMIEKYSVDDISHDNIKNGCRIINFDNILESRSNRFSIFQIKYQSYIEPDMTKKIVEIQNYLTWAAQDIRIYKDNKGEGIQSKEAEIQEIIKNTLCAVKLSKHIIEDIDFDSIT